MAKRPNPFLGKWRIVEMEQWDRDYIDLVVPGYIKFERDGTGSFQFGVVEGGLDFRIEVIGGAESIEFLWFWNSEIDEACGRGWAMLQGQMLNGRIFIHGSDDSAFRADKSAARSRHGVA